MSFLFTVMYYSVLQKNVHALNCSSTAVGIAILNQPVYKVTAHKTTRVHTEVIAPVSDHGTIMVSMKSVSQVLSNQDNLQRFWRAWIRHFQQRNAIDPAVKWRTATWSIFVEIENTASGDLTRQVDWGVMRSSRLFVFPPTECWSIWLPDRILVVLYFSPRMSAEKASLMIPIY